MSFARIIALFTSVVVGNILAWPIHGSPKSILHLQKNLQTTTIEHPTSDYIVNFYDLNPAVGSWYIIEFIDKKKRAVATSDNESLPESYSRFFHIENPWPGKQTVSLSKDFNQGLVLQKEGKSINCTLWQKSSPRQLIALQKKSKPYIPICENALFLRNKIEGYYTTKEWVAEFVRDNLWGGDALTNLVKSSLYEDKFLLESSGNNNSNQMKYKAPKNAPKPARIKKEFEHHSLLPHQLGLEVFNHNKTGEMLLGRWYPVKSDPGMYVSVLFPEAIHDDILKSYRHLARPLDSVEKKALTYVVAFDLREFDLRWSLGTEHPRLGWSERVPDKVVKDTPGPDGIGTSAPIVQTGLVNPHLAKRIAASFTGGFKRMHGAFRKGTYSVTNDGSHYGFVENGVMFSRLHPGLATVLIKTSGDIELRTWQKNDDLQSAKVLFARQNGVPIVEWDQSKNQPKPGRFVGNWGHGNWSGSQTGKQRSLRAGLCQLADKKSPFLVYGYFSSVTPNSMARVFQAYECRYALHLDMNALEHTYLARYKVKKGKKGKVPEHLVKGMRVLDRRFKGNVPRFIGYPDNRDFFYLLRKQPNAGNRNSAITADYSPPASAPAPNEAHKTTEVSSSEQEKQPAQKTAEQSTEIEPLADDAQEPASTKPTFLEEELTTPSSADVIGSDQIIPQKVMAIEPTKPIQSSAESKAPASDEHQLEAKDLDEDEDENEDENEAEDDQEDEDEDEDSEADSKPAPDISQEESKEPKEDSH